MRVHFRTLCYRLFLRSDLGNESHSTRLLRHGLLCVGRPLARHAVAQQHEIGDARVGIRYDLTWRSFDWVRDEWAGMLAEDGAAITQWCAGDRTGEAAEETLSDLRGFAADQEGVVSGLGN